jgi:GntR family transcriptional regulator
MGEAMIEERAATPQEANQLRVPQGTQVLSAARVILTGARPVAYLIDIVPTRYLRAQDLGPAFDGSVLDVLIRRGEPTLSHSRTDILAEAADEGLARKLHLQRGDALLKFEAQLYTREGQVVDYSLSYFVPGYFHFHVVRRVAGANDKSSTPPRDGGASVSNLKDTNGRR